MKTSPKDVFLHLLLMIALYTSAIQFITLIFQYITIFIPDALRNDSYAITHAYDSIRFAIASLIVSFPVYIGTSWFLEKQYAAEPEKRSIKIRKWLIYFTLFVAAIIICGDIVTLVYHFLGGELTIQFLLKLLTVFFVAGSVFFYYFSDIRKYRIE